jgi:N-acetyl-alpha-D-muramate 1-phosphate uridylyltransferase
MTKVMLLAAGRGVRLRPITDTTPKPLVKINGKTLIEYHLENCAHAGYTDIVINLAHLGHKIKQYLGDGSRWGVKLSYSPEPEGGLETGGGIVNALPLLGNEPFITINADIYSQFNLALLPNALKHMAHLILVNNPNHNVYGDFNLNEAGLIDGQKPSYTFSGIACYHPSLFNALSPGRFSVVPIIRENAAKNQVTGELYQGDWFDIGTKERLAEANKRTFSWQ